jgi:uncharacterized protein YdeI (YjbR/CyaY-like superfamily)
VAGFYEYTIDMEVVYIPTRTALRTWLRKNHATSKGVWLMYDKGLKRKLTNTDITAECICFGWIDSKVGKVDALRSKIYISPRNPKSNWSRVNKRLVTELTKLKLLHSSGRAVIQAAKKSGTWTALDAVENLSIPSDLAAELQKRRHAAEYFNAFPRSVKRGILEWIQTAKKPETRSARIIQTATMAAVNKRANQYRK